jgi:hypothetical protein
MQTDREIAFGCASELARSCVQQCRNVIASVFGQGHDLDAFAAFVDGFMDDHGVTNLLRAIAHRERQRAKEASVRSKESDSRDEWISTEILDTARALEALANHIDELDHEDEEHLESRERERRRREQGAGGRPGAGLPPTE